MERLIPYFENREDGVKFVAQTKQAMAHWMPSALNDALNDARRAYGITHHGATVADPMELASYFQNPMDGARYLDFLARRPSAK
jgi:hypothetical protein